MQRRKRTKKPQSDSDSESKKSKKQTKKQSDESKDTKSEENPQFSFDTDFDIEVKDGINDLAMLPRELIESELISRGFHPDMTDALDTKFLVNTLRGGKFIPKEEDKNDINSYYYSYYSYHQAPQVPIFDDTSEAILQKRKEEEKKKIEEEEEEEMLENAQKFNPDEFTKDNLDKQPDEEDNENATNLNPFLFPNQFIIKKGRRPMNFQLKINLLNYGFDVDKINDGSKKNDKLIKKMENDHLKHYSIEDIIFRNFILNSPDDDNEYDDNDDDNGNI